MQQSTVIPASSSASTPGNSLGERFQNPEIVIGLVGAVGTQLNDVERILSERLERFKYKINKISISKNVIPLFGESYPDKSVAEYDRIWSMMDAGNKARKDSEDNAILALGAASIIWASRELENEMPKLTQNTVHIISSLKHPEEVHCLRQIYPNGFYLLGVHTDEQRRQDFCVNDKGMKEGQAKGLMARDRDEHLDYGQKVSDTFHLSDFFIRLDGDDDRSKNSIWRIIDLLFAHPYTTPTFDEYAMFLAFAASLRSADLSRQVGAVIARDCEILATGANDCPKPGGGLYWPEYNKHKKNVEDEAEGRDYKRGIDSNKLEQKKIIDDILENVAEEVTDKERLRSVLEKSRIRDLTEFGRVVHAEMEAMLSCARNGISTRHGTLYCTTYPCHNCAKHLIAAGIKRVVYIEPYPKSKAGEFHSEAIESGLSADDSERQDHKKVQFEPFIGVGPRRFFDLFSMGLGAGRTLKRKNKEGKIFSWEPANAKLRLQMLQGSYLDLELIASQLVDKFTKQGDDK